MAASDKREEAEEQEKTIPVFTVLKNNAILKNIFLLDNPPSVRVPKPFNPLKNSDQVQEFEETLLVGRHPDCNITLEHPSPIPSPNPLQTHFSQALRHRFVIRALMCSWFLIVLVHGTWVLGKKIEPGIRVELNEGDTVRLGSSSRVYRLHWVPVSRAYDMENPFVPPSDVSVQVEESKREGTHQIPQPSAAIEVQSEIKKLETCPGELERNLNFLECLESSFSHEEIEKKCLLREDYDQSEMSCFFDQPLLEESVNSPLPSRIVISRIDDQQLDKENQYPEPLFGTEELTEIENPGSFPMRSERKFSLLISLNSSISGEQEGHQVAEVFHVVENEDPLRKHHDLGEIPFLQSGHLATESVKSCLPGGSALSEIEGQQFDEANQSPETPFATGGFQKEDPGSPQIKSEQKSNLLGGSVLSDIESQQFHEANQSPRTPFATGGSQKENPGSPLIKSEQNIESQQFHESNQSPRTRFATGGSQKENPGIPLIKSEQKSNLLGGSVLSDIESQQFHDANQSPRTPFATGGSQKENPGIPLLKSEQKSNLLGGSVLSDIESQQFHDANQSPRTPFATGGSQKENPGSPLIKSEQRKRIGSDINAEVELLHQGDIENDVISKALFTDLDDDEEEDFTPDKRINNDGQLVLLTNGSTLKIKAMEEGLVCETAQEFRDSLVNPFSERFLWAALREEGLGLVQMMLF
ncbi:hypothetical protein ACSBR2_040087 [Camellia fascicularis]